MRNVHPSFFTLLFFKKGIRKMNVKGLKEKIKELPDAMEVYISSDEEGNRINRLEGYGSEGYVFDGEIFYPDCEEAIQIIEEEKLKETLILWP